MKVVPTSWQTVGASEILEGSPIADLLAPLLSGQLLAANKDLLSTALLERQQMTGKHSRSQLTPPGAATAPSGPSMAEIVKFLEGLGFSAEAASMDCIRVATSVPGVTLEIHKTPNGPMKAQLKGADGRVHAELSSFTSPGPLLHFLHSHQIGAPKIGQRAETAVRRPLANRPLVDMGF